MKHYDSSGREVVSTVTTPPGGSDKQVQFNDAGVFNGDAGLAYDKSTAITSVGGPIKFAAVSNPSAAPTDTLYLYGRKVAGRMVPKWTPPSGLDTPVQAALWGNATYMWQPTSATAGLWISTVGAGAGTFANKLPTTTNIYTAMKRAEWANVVTTTNQVLGQMNTEAIFYRGATTSQGGFFFFCRFGFANWASGGRMFVGMATANTVVSANPSALANTAGFCVEDTDSGAISFLTKDASTSNKSSSIATIGATNSGYDAYIFCKPNDSTIYYRLDDLNAQTTLIDSSTSTNLPVNTTMLKACALGSNAALTVVTTINIGVNRIYVETDH